MAAAQVGSLLYAMIQVLVPLNPILELAGHIHHHHGDLCLSSVAWLKTACNIISL